jgi:AcrR family transcriptional regulator
MVYQKSNPKPVGRPRAFDSQKALERALKVFRRKGYEGTSLSDLTKAMGINRPSLYAAFGDKEELFRKALARYGQDGRPRLTEALNRPTARAVVEKFLNSSINFMTDPKNPAGCLSVQGALACGESATPIQKELISYRSATAAALRERLERAKAEGDLPADSDPAALARYVATVNEGLSVEASGGATRKQLHQTAAIALQAFPEQRSTG